MLRRTLMLMLLWRVRGRALVIEQWQVALVLWLLPLTLVLVSL
mgnify:CR=1 FL=1